METQLWVALGVFIAVYALLIWDKINRAVVALLGASALAAGLVLCLAVDHASMAVLVWVMALAGAALVVAFTLAWRARWLGILAPWVRAGGAARR